jgi:hypothetical protein
MFLPSSARAELQQQPDFFQAEKGAQRRFAGCLL